MVAKACAILAVMYLFSFFHIFHALSFSSDDNRIEQQSFNKIVTEGSFNGTHSDINDATDCLPISIGILAYQGVKTLENTLSSYQTSGLFDIVCESLILFQEVGKPDRKAWARDVVSRFQCLHPIYESTNTGQRSAFVRLAAEASQPHILILEEDFMVSDMALPQLELKNAIWLLDTGILDAIRMRHRKDGGSPNYSYESWKHRTLPNTHLISHVMWDDAAEEHIPEIKVCSTLPVKTWCTSSANGHYTNNPIVYRTAFARSLFNRVPVASNFEPWLTKFWSKQNYTTGYADGIFKHNRLDRTKGIITTSRNTPVEGKGSSTTNEFSHSSSSSRNVIMAAAINYGLEEFQNFIVPLRKVYGGDIILFVEPNLQDKIQHLCNFYSVKTMQLRSKSRIGPKADRYVGYAQICSQGYEWCFATDFRDVFFQADPFSSVLNGYELILAEEFAGQTIGGCKYNSEWIRSCWGDMFLKEIAYNSPICSGTIMGSPKGFVSLRDRMLEEMSRTSKITGCTARDQGHLNYLYFANRLGVKTLLQPRGKGIVNTVGYIPRGSISNYLNSDGLVLDDNGSISAVIHQYDRFPELKNLVARLAISS